MALEIIKQATNVANCARRIITGIAHKVGQNKRKKTSNGGLNPTRMNTEDSGIRYTSATTTKLDKHVSGACAEMHRLLAFPQIVQTVL